MAAIATRTTFIHVHDLPWARAVNMETVENFRKGDDAGEYFIIFVYRDGQTMWKFGNTQSCKDHRNKVYARIIEIFSEEL